MKRLLCLLGLCALLGAAQPAWAVDDGLPPPALVQRQLLALPEVQAAQAGLRASQAAGERLQAGPHEVTLRLAAQQRRVRELDALGQPRTRQGLEPQLSLERALRWPGKAAQDQALADAGLRLAQLQRADAVHEAGRVLLRDWFDLQRELALAQLWQAQHTHQAALVDTSQRRVRAGDAARSELSGQLAVLAQIEASRLQAQARVQAAQAAWAGRYPLIPVPETSPVAALSPVAQDSDPGSDLAALRERLVSDDHGVLLAQAEASWASAQAQRSTLEQRPDPTLGLHLAREQRGSERVLGVSLSLPLGGAGRAADSRQARAQAEAQAARAEQRRRERLGEAASQTVMVAAALSTWQAQAEAEAQASAALQAAQRGWSLGEYPVSEVHQARRQQAEAALGALSARLEAVYLQRRLQLDLHQLWDFGDD